VYQYSNTLKANQAGLRIAVPEARAFAELTKQRFTIAKCRHGLTRGRDVTLDLSLFRPPRPATPQGELFARP
jgi:hypothetical protein